MSDTRCDARTHHISTQMTHLLVSAKLWCNGTAVCYLYSECFCRHIVVEEHFDVPAMFLQNE